MMMTAMNHSLKPGQKLGTARVAPKIKAQRIFLSHKMAVKAQASDSDAKTTVSHGFDVNALALAAAMPTAWLVSEGAFRVRPHSHPLASTRVHSPVTLLSTPVGPTPRCIPRYRDPLRVPTSSLIALPDIPTHVQLRRSPLDASTASSRGRS